MLKGSHEQLNKVGYVWSSAHAAHAHYYSSLALYQDLQTIAQYHIEVEVFMGLSVGNSFERFGYPATTFSQIFFT